MTSLRKTAIVAGVLYLLSFASVPTLALYAPVRDPNYVVGPGPDTGVTWGGVLEIVVALACIGTAVVLYPVVKRQNEGVALGFVGVRVLEAANPSRISTGPGVGAAESDVHPRAARMRSRSSASGVSVDVERGQRSQARRGRVDGGTAVVGPRTPGDASPA